MEARRRMGGGGRVAGAMYPDEVWEHVFSFLEAGADRNAVSEVCKGWHRMERLSRRRLLVSNCFAVDPEQAVERFPDVRVVELKGKPHFMDFNPMPGDWGSDIAEAWVGVMAESWPHLEELRMKSMDVSDECLELIAKSFKNFKALSLVSCDGFSTEGLAAIAAGCRNLRVLDLQENEVEENCPNWLSQFPDSFTSLVTLNIACLNGEVNVTELERLIGRCPNLKTIRLNDSVPLEKFADLLRRAPQLVDIGTGIFSSEYRTELYTKVEAAFAGCKHLRSVSGFREAGMFYLSAMYSVCEGLTSLNLSYATIRSSVLTELISQCKNLQKLSVTDLIEDIGLYAVASSCKLLHELRVFPFDPYGAAHGVSLTEHGLVSVSAGCPKLQSVLYYCRQMTNDALITVAKNRPNLTCFRVCIIEPYTPDYVTQQPLDVGFSAIVESCKDLRRLSLSGLVTDEVFKLIGASANCLEMLSVAFAGDSDKGLQYILSGCKNLKKLEIRDCPFGDEPLLANAARLETMRSLWMSSCSVTLKACKLLADTMPTLNVEVIDERVEGNLDDWPENSPVEKVYIYRTIAERYEKPPCVLTV